MIGKKKTKKYDSRWDGLEDEVTRDEVVDAMPRKWWKPLFAKYVFIAPLALPLMVIALVLSSGTIKNAQAQIEKLNQVQSVMASSPGRTEATKALNAWLESPSKPIPGGRVISWDGAKTIPVTTRKDKNGTDITEKVNYTSEVNTFSVQDGLGSVYTVAVQVKIDPRGGALVATAPSIIATTTANHDGWDEGSPWPGIEDDQSVTTDSVTTAVDGWAQAYVSGDPRKLTVATGDPDQTKTYIPLSNVSKVKTEVLYAAPKDVTKPDVIIAQVEMTMAWLGQKADQSGGLPTTMTMDILVERANTASPIVTAWGAPGTGPELVRYGNAVPMREISKSSAAPTDELSPTPTPKATPSTAPTKKK